MEHVQVAIIGGGVIGSAIAYELSRYYLSVAVFEAGSDVASGTSKANSGVLHSGINSAPGSLKAQFCVEGNALFPSLSQELGVPIRTTGKFVVAKNADEYIELERLKNIGIQNGVKNLEIIDGKTVKKREPYLSCYAALWVPSAGIVSPYNLTIALAETAAINGVQYYLNHSVTELDYKNSFILTSKTTRFTADIVINAAGVHCLDIVSMLETPDFKVYPCRGEYLVLDKTCGHMITSMIYPMPVKSLGVLGVHITPTMEGNILLGPSAEFIEDGDDTRTTQETMQTLLCEAKEILPVLPSKAVISAYAGIRCKLASPTEGGWADYRIEESKYFKGFINMLGIESPGLTAAPAIAKKIVKMIADYVPLKKKKYMHSSPRPKRFSEMSLEEQTTCIARNPRWGRIVCRCEQVTEAEIINALSNPLGARSISAIKYRCRVGMGRCQGGFCTQHVIRIMSEFFGMDIHNIHLKSPESVMFHGQTRGDNNE